MGTKVSGLTTTSTLASTDLIYVVKDAAASPVSRAITLANLFANGNGLKSVKDYGALGDARHVDDGAINTGVSNVTLTSATANFVAADVGKTVMIKGAGASGVPLITTIASRTNSTTVTLTAAASTTVSGKRVIIGTNDTSAISTAMAAMSAKQLYFPPGAYLIRMTATANGAVTVPSGTMLIGDGAGSVIYIIGSDGAAGGGVDDDNKAAFYVSGSNVRITGLSFVGENGPFTYVAQNQSNVILVATGVDTVSIDHCEFHDLYGFPAHQVGSASRVHFNNNLVSYCANGVNINADYSNQSNNHVYHSEGFETSMAYGTVSHNLIEYPYVAGISLGGRTGVADVGYGTTCIGNVIKESQGQGIAVNDGFAKGIVSGNTIYNALLPGIQIVSGGYNVISDNEISNNVLVNVGSSVSGPVGISVDGAGDRTRILNNQIQTDWSGITLGDGADGVEIRGNRIDGGFKDLRFGDATNTRLEDNELLNSTYEFAGTAATFARVNLRLVGSPAQITAAQNDYDIGIYSTLRMSSDAARNITGFKYGATERVLVIVNVGSNNIVLKNQDAGSAAANRIITGTGGDITLAADGVATLKYDSTTARWRVQ